MLERFVIIIFDILLIFFGVYLISRYQAWFTKHRLKIISVFIVLGICLYTIGYLSKSRGPLDSISSGLMAIFSTGRMFVFENDISSFETNVADKPLYNILFGLIMALSMLATGMIVLSLLGYRVMSKLQLKFIWLFSKKKKVYIFTRLNENSLNLANDIKKNNKDSITILCVDGSNVSEECIKLEKEASKHRHLIYTIYDKKDMIFICLKFIKSRMFLFAISEDIYDNVSFVKLYADSHKKRKIVNAKVSLYAFIDYDICENAFLSEDYLNLDLHIIDINDLVPRQLFEQFTLMSTHDKGDVLTVCIIGFSEICINLYRNIIYLGQCDGIKLKLILVDDNIRDKTASFFNKNPEIEKCVSFEFIEEKPDTVQYYKKLKEQLQNMNCIIVAMNHIASVAEISRLCLYNNAKAKICAYIKDYDKYEVLLETPLLEKVICFGSTKELFTEKHIINEILDQLAKKCHEYYMTIYNDTRKWEEISLFEKQSNRALALHFQSKLYSVGLRYDKGGNVSIYEELIKDSTAFERLSKAEHLRWNAYHYVNGWRTMTDIQAGKKNKDDILKLHSCLVDWDELDGVSSVFGKDYKKADRLLIQNLGKIVSSVGYGLSKID